MTAQRSFSNVVGFDDAPFPRDHRGRVDIVGTVYARLRLDGVLMGHVDRDGSDAADAVTGLISGSKFREHIQLILLQGIAFAGFNVIDVFSLFDSLKLPILVVARKPPDMDAIRAALVHRVEDGEAKWRIIERLGPMEPLDHIYVQRVGISLEESADVVRTFAAHGHVPEPLRTAHLIAGAVSTGVSRGGV
jgi:endonuclease V-like protein UPF0215 family